MTSTALRRSVLRNVIAVLAVGAVLAVSAPLAPAPARAEGGVTGGASAGGTQSFDTSFDNNFSGSGGTRTCGGKWNGAGYLDSVPMYAYHPACDPEVPASEGFRQSSVKSCLLGFHVWRFYGTVAKPAQGATLSEVKLRDWCLSADQVKAQMWWPNPMDTITVTPYEPRIWNIKNLSDDFTEAWNANHNFQREPLVGSAFCWRADDKGPINLRNGCPLTTAQPIAYAGKRCSTLVPYAKESMWYWLSYGTEQQRAKAKQILAAHYNQLVDLGAREIVAATLADFPNTTMGTPWPPAITMNDVVATDRIPCSSPVDFVKMPSIDPNVPDDPTQQRQLGVCIAAVEDVGFASAGTNPRVSLYYEGVGGGKLRTRYSSSSVGLPRSGNTFEVDMQKVIALRKSSPIRAQYLKMMKQTLVNLGNAGSMPGKNPALPDIPGKWKVPMGWYWPSNVDGLTWQQLVPTSGNYYELSGDGGSGDRSTMATLEDTAACYTSVLNPNVAGIDASDGKTPVPPPPSAPPACTVNCGGTDSLPPGASAAGPVRVYISMPNANSVAGFYRTFTTRVTGATLMCGTRACAHAPDNTDPTLASPVRGLLVHKSVGAGADKFRRCTSAQSTAGCGYVLKASASSTSASLVGQTVQANYFSATPRGVQVEAAVDSGRAVVQYYKWEQYSVWVSDPCPTYWDATLMKYVTAPGPCGHYEPRWRVVPDYQATVGVELVAAPGTDSPLRRIVYGSVGN